MIGRIAASFVEIESELEAGILPLGRIGVEGMQFHAFWGADAQERLLGYAVEIDVKVTTPLLAAAAADDLAKTVNYQGIYDVCRFVADDYLTGAKEAAIQIEARLKGLFSNLYAVEIVIRQPAPHAEQPNCVFSHKRAKAYLATCPRCDSDTVCYNSSACWCQKEKLFSRTLDVLHKQFGDECLCMECLKIYAR